MKTHTILLSMAFGMLVLFTQVACKKKESGARQDGKVPTEMIGTWDKKDAVRLTVSADGTFTAQRWVASSNSYANNFAVKGVASVQGNKLNVKVDQSNLAHLWSQQKIESISATFTLANGVVTFSDVSVLPQALDVKDAVINRLSNQFVKNEKPSTSLPMEDLSFSAVKTFQPTEMPGIKPWTYQNGQFNMTISKYDLGIATPDQSAQGLAFSGMGQHLHLIVDDSPYIAQANNPFTYTMADGEHTVLIFASRSYHESYKNPEAIVMSKIRVVNNTEVAGSRTNITDPTVFASRPVRGYSIGKKEHEKILVDFVTNDAVTKNMNTTTGHSVRITIDETPYLTTQWTPLVFTGLSRKGEHKVSVQLYNHATKKVVKTVNQSFTITD